MFLCSSREKWWIQVQPSMFMESVFPKGLHSLSIFLHSPCHINKKKTSIYQRSGGMHKFKKCVSAVTKQTASILQADAAVQRISEIRAQGYSASLSWALIKQAFVGDVSCLNPADRGGCEALSYRGRRKTRVAFSIMERTGEMPFIFLFSPSKLLRVLSERHCQKETLLLNYPPGHSIISSANSRSFSVEDLLNLRVFIVTPCVVLGSNWPICSF